MPTDDVFISTVVEAEGLAVDAFLRDWRQLRERLDRGSHDLADGHLLRQRHFAFRKVAIVRFGVKGHVERYNAAAV